MKLRTFDVALELFDVALNQYKETYQRNEAKVKDFMVTCRYFDEMIDDGQLESLDVAIDEKDMSVCVTMTGDYIDIEDALRECFSNIVFRSDEMRSWSPRKNADFGRLQFVFHGIFEKRA